MIEALKELNAKLTADKQGYDLFMEEVLPLYGESRSHIGKPETEVLTFILPLHLKLSLSLDSIACVQHGAVECRSTRSGMRIS